MTVAIITVTKPHELLQILENRIAANGLLHFSEYLDVALYHADVGFYSTGGQAGRRGDFITSPEVGPLFGACLARYLDDVWESLGQPDVFTVVDAGAGPGTLARSILAAAPKCGRALDYVAVEVSAAQRGEHPAGVRSLAEVPGPIEAGVVVANELLDNLPFDIYQRTDGRWCEVLIDVRDGRLSECLGPPKVVEQLPDVVDGARLPLIDRAVDWVEQALSNLSKGRLLVIDYASSTEEMVSQKGGWLQTYRANERGSGALDIPGQQDITAQVPIEQLLAHRPADRLLSQAEFLPSCGIDELVEEGRRIWAERAHLGDLAAVKARSRVSEAEALLDPEGLGRFVVFEWVN